MSCRESQLEANRVVEIIKPSYGSGYCIGGGLILTCRHLFKDYKNDCRVRFRLCFDSRKSVSLSGEVVWRADENIDIALVEVSTSELLERIGISYESVKFAEFIHTQNIIADICLYTWPKFFSVKQRNGDKYLRGGLELNGTISTNNVLPPENLYILEVDKGPAIFSSITEFSHWRGASGAAVLCDKKIIGVQSKNFGLIAPRILQAAPISRVFTNEEWKELLRKYNISTELDIIRLAPDGSTEYSSNNRIWTCRSTKIWELHKSSNPNCRDLLVLGGIFGKAYLDSSSNNKSFDLLELESYLHSILDMGARVTVLLQDMEEESFLQYLMSQNIKFELFEDEFNELKNLFLHVIKERNYMAGGRMILTSYNIFSIAKYGLFSEFIHLRNNDAISHSAEMQYILRNQFRGYINRQYEIHKFSNRDLDIYFGDTEERREFYICRDHIDKIWEETSMSDTSCFYENQ